LADSVKDCLDRSEVVSAGHIADQFERLRWRFCPVEFGVGMGRDLCSEMILAIQKREQINSKGATADLWRIDVPEEFVHSDLESVVPHSRSKTKDPDLGMHVSSLAAHR
jgi:hypothetical protein